MPVLALALAAPPWLPSMMAQRTVPDWRQAVSPDTEKTYRPLQRQQSAARLNPALPDVRPGEFVTRTGTALMLAGRPFRFSGNNTYYLQAEIAYNRLAGVEESLDKLAGLGIAVTRANAHNDHPPAQDPAAIQLQPGVFAEASLVALDRSIAEARRRNIRLVLKLTNNWEAYGGIRRYVEWKLGRSPAPAEYSLFYTDSTIRQWYKDYVRMVINRRNTVTGVAYLDEPAILAWELGNELRNPGPATSAAALVAWTAEMAAFIRGIDPNHLIADGGEGFDDDPSLYPGLSNRYAVGGQEGASYHRLAEIPELDMLSYHLYPAAWGLNDAADALVWIRRHEEIARGAGKVAYLGEYGRRAGNQNPAGCNAAPGRQFDAERARIFAVWLNENTVAQGSAGHMAWQLINDARNDCEGYQIYCPTDGATCDLLRRLSELANAPQPVAVSGASYRPHWLAPDAYASLFGVGFPSGVRVAIADSRGAERDALVTYESPGQINFVVPGAVAPGGAVVRVTGSVDGTIRHTAVMSILRAEPGVFSANASGAGLAAAVVTTQSPDGSRTIRLVTDGQIDLAAGDAVLSLYGTGWRYGRAAEARIGGVPATVLYAGLQGEYPGLDQMNLRIPPTLAGRGGVVEVEVSVDGRRANPVGIAVR